MKKTQLRKLVRQAVIHKLDRITEGHASQSTKDPFIPTYGTGDVIHDCPKHVQEIKTGIKGKVIGHTLNESGAVNFVDVDFGTGKVFKNIPTKSLKILEMQEHAHNIKEETGDKCNCAAVHPGISHIAYDSQQLAEDLQVKPAVDDTRGSSLGYKLTATQQRKMLAFLKKHQSNAAVKELISTLNDKYSSSVSIKLDGKSFFVYASAGQLRIGHSGKVSRWSGDSQDALTRYIGEAVLLENVTPRQVSKAYNEVSILSLKMIANLENYKAAKKSGNAADIKKYIEVARTLTAKKKAAEAAMETMITQLDKDVEYVGEGNNDSKNESIVNEAPMDKSFMQDWQKSCKALQNHVKHELDKIKSGKIKSSDLPHGYYIYLNKSINTIKDAMDIPTHLAYIGGLNEGSKDEINEAPMDKSFMHESNLKGTLSGKAAENIAKALSLYVKGIIQQPNNNYTYLQLFRKADSSNVIKTLKGVFGLESTDGGMFKADRGDGVMVSYATIKFSNDKIVERKSKLKENTGLDTNLLKESVIPKNKTRAKMQFNIKKWQNEYLKKDTINESITRLDEKFGSSKLAAIFNNITQHRWSGAREFLNGMAKSYGIQWDKLTNDMVTGPDKTLDRKGIDIIIASKDVLIPHSTAYDWTTQVSKGQLLGVSINGKRVWLGNVRYSGGRSARGPKTGAGSGRTFFGLDKRGYSNIRSLLNIDGAVVYHIDPAQQARGAGSTQSDRATAKAGATALLSAKNAKDQNLNRYRQALTLKAGVAGEQAIIGMIEKVNKIYEQALATKLDKLKQGMIPRDSWVGDALKAVSNRYGSMVSAFEQYMRAGAELKAYKVRHPEQDEDVWETGYHTRQMAEYAKEVKDEYNKLTRELDKLNTADVYVNVSTLART
jgi:hypothetical protein